MKYAGVTTYHPLTVWCDRTDKTDVRGWIVIMRRQYKDHRIHFPTQTYQQYQEVFGSPHTNFWLGLEHMHRLTNVHGNATLRVDLEDSDGNRAHAQYTYFRVTSQEDGYRLFADGYSGDAGDSLSSHSGFKFSTVDRDNDSNKDAHCAQTYEGAWWYNACHSSSLNGEYREGPQEAYAKYIVWHAWKGYHYSIKKVEMKIML